VVRQIANPRVLARSASAATLGACLALIAGCAGLTASRGVGGASLVGSRNDLSPVMLLARLDERRDAIHSLRATAKLEASLDDPDRTARPQRLRASQAVLARTPAAFRLEALSPFGVSYAVACDGRDLAIFVPSERLLYRGSANPASIGRATDVAVSAPDVVSLLLGLPPLSGIDRSTAWVSLAGPAPAGEGSARKADEVAPQAYLHAARDGGETVVIGFAALPLAGEALVPVSYERISAQGTRELRAGFADFAAQGSAHFATVVSVDTSDARLRIRYTDFELNPVIDDARFALTTPRGVREEPLDLAGEEGQL
jgi:hypothetical protein